MILYLKPPLVIVNLRSFTECCYSRFRYFIKTTKLEHSPDMVEELVPGTVLDKIGHFVLKCYCSYDPSIAEFILNKEIELFVYRLKLHSVSELRNYCRKILKDLDYLRNYRAKNVLSNELEFPNDGSLLFSALRCIASVLQRNNVCRHFVNECEQTCNQYNVEVPFQMCLSLVKSRLVVMKNGIASIPCGLWPLFLEELYRHHYYFGISMISTSALSLIRRDDRWLEIFRKLKQAYERGRSRRSQLPKPMVVSAQQVDRERQYFPPCMSHLLTVLRNNHRLSHDWRYYFSLFLKDVGLPMNESIRFWQTEYTKPCGGGTSCDHSWSKNERKYRYSIRHMYGLEGRKFSAKSKSCSKFQNLQLRPREEGGCPFVHFDESDLLKTMSKSIVQQDDVVAEIMDLRNAGKASEACFVHMLKLTEYKLQDQDRKPVKVEQHSCPVAYYHTIKTCLNNSDYSW